MTNHFLHSRPLRLALLPLLFLVVSGTAGAQVVPDSAIRATSDRVATKRAVGIVVEFSITGPEISSGSYADARGALAGPRFEICR